MKALSLTLAVSALALASVAVFARQDEGAGMPQPIKPTEQHKLLEKKAGSWDATVEMTGMPVSKSVYTAKLDCGGLWLIGDYRGEFMGTPFVGHEVEGYSSEKGKYVATWVDSWIDHVMVLEGDYDAKTQTLSMWTDGKDLAGKPIKERHDTKFVDADTFVFTMNHPDATGTLAPVMTITYKRKK